MAFLYTPRFGSVDKKRCRAAVSSPGIGFFSHQCTRKATVFRNNIGYCKTHDPVVVDARHKAREAGWRAKWAEDEARAELANKIHDANEAAKKALEAIEAGHNDPRSLARETLALYPKEIKDE